MAWTTDSTCDHDTDMVVSTILLIGTAIDEAMSFDAAINSAENVEQAEADKEIEAIVADSGQHARKLITPAVDLAM